jgi:oligopeptide transport system ATP-binding protein
MPPPLLQVENLTKSFARSDGWFRRSQTFVHAVSGVSFEIAPGETLGLVGESGCGKSTLGRLVLRLTEPTSGSIRFDGTEVTSLSTKKLRAFRKNAQMVFQDPYASLNPRMKVDEIVREPLEIHGLGSRADWNAQTRRALEKVGLNPEAMNRYPREFSGGQRQRIGIARALALRPRFIVADEAVSSLDVSVQAQILNLLLDLQEQEGIAYLFISHDLRVVEFVAHRVAVMYLGKIMELLPAKGLHASAQHPYTKALLEAVPEWEAGKKRKRIVLKGELPNAMNPPSGCVFHTRCPLAEERCKTEQPVLRNVGKDHFLACHLV